MILNMASISSAYVLRSTQTALSFISPLCPVRTFHKMAVKRQSKTATFVFSFRHMKTSN